MKYSTFILLCVLYSTVCPFALYGKGEATFQEEINATLFTDDDSTDVVEDSIVAGFPTKNASIHGIRSSSNNSDFSSSFAHITPKAPNVAGLVNAIDIPVSLYTGIPNISLPLYEIEVDGVRIPISLSYHSSGIRVNQESSWVGLGWSLNAGGLVSRTVKCGDDFNEVLQGYIQEGFLTAPEVDLPRENGYIGTFYQDFSYSENHLVKDSEPDIFYYSLPSASGKFLIDKSRGPVLVDRGVDVRIQLMNDGQFKKYFIITTPDGTKYTFNKYEKTLSVSRMGPITENSPTPQRFDESEDRWNEADYEGTPYYSAPFEYTSSWMLTDIETVNGKHVTFTYEADSYQQPLQESVNKYHIIAFLLNGHIAGPGNHSIRYSCSKSVVYSWRLSRITWDAGYATFTASSREDERGSSSGNEPKKLDAVRIYNNNDELVDGYSFVYGYFNSDYSGTYPHVFKRLKLNQLKKMADENYAYTFDYFPGNLPAKNSNNTDYWGYYNGVEQGPNYYCPVVYENILYPGADKRSRLEYTKIGTLKSISSPTKGTTLFEYEANQYKITPNISTVTTHVNEILNVYNEYQSDLYNQYPQYTSRTITLEAFTTIHLSGFAESELCEEDPNIRYDHEDNATFKISKVLSSGARQLLFYYPTPSAMRTECSYTFPNDSLILGTGTYIIEAESYARDTWYAFRYDFDKTETIVTDSIQTGGGLRIASIRGEKWREYTYEGGKLMIDPCFGRTKMFMRPEWFEDRAAPVRTNYLIQTSESTVPMSTLKDGNILGYSKVTEGVGSEVTEHYFYNSQEVSQGGSYFPFLPTVYDPLNGLTQRTIQGGKTVEYLYNYIEGPEVNAFMYEEVEDEIHPYSYPIRWPVVTRMNTTMQESNGTMTFRNDYTYDDHLMRLTDSLNDGFATYTKRYIYPTASAGGILSVMADKYMVGKPVEEIQMYNGNVVSGRRTNYTQTAGLIVPAEEQTLETTTGLPLTDYASQYTTRVTYSNYTSQGYPMQVSTDGLNTVYLWGYNGISPVAEIKNATYSQVSQLLTEPFITNMTGKVAPTASDMGTISSLRTSLPSSFVTTYEYKPLVGLTKMTDCRGFTTCYIYDSLGRLTQTSYLRGGQPAVTQSYEYHLKN